MQKLAGKFQGAVFNYIDTYITIKIKCSLLENLVIYVFYEVIITGRVEERIFTIKASKKIYM